MRGLPDGRPAVMPTRSPGLNQPSSTTRTALAAISSSVMSIFLIDAACDAPHQPAAADRLAARGEGVDRHRRAVGGDQAGRAARQRRADERREAELVRRAARPCRRPCRRGRGGRGGRGARSTPGRARSAPCARRSRPASRPRRRGSGRRRSPGRASRRRCRRGSRWRRRSPRRGSGASCATIESSICVAVITGCPSAPAQPDDLLLDDRHLLDAHLDAEVAARDHHAVGRARRSPPPAATACGFSILAISGSRVCCAHGSRRPRRGARTRARRGRRRSSRPSRGARCPPRAPRAAPPSRRGC